VAGNAQVPHGNSQERWLCEQLLRARIDLASRVLTSTHPAGFHSPRGPFSDYDIHYILRGSIEYDFDGHVLRAKQGSFCLLPPGKIFIEQDVKRGRGAELLYIHFSITMAGGRDPLQALELPAVIKPRKAAAAEKLCRETLADSRQGSDGRHWSHLAMKARVIEMLAALLQDGFFSGALRLNAARSGPEWLWPVLQRVEDELASAALSVERLAEAAMLSPSHFTHQFKRFMNVAPMQFVMQRRIALATDLLISDKALSIKAIAARCGFTDPYHFSAQFKRYVRQSPSHFRARN
jgi:AraC-like DNA-binding protein